MLALTDPAEAYRRSQLDARIQGGDPAELVRLCLEQAVTGLGTAILAHERGDPLLRSKGLTRALTALTALEMGVDRQAPLAPALLQFYGAARAGLLDCAVRFDGPKLATIRADFIDVASAMGARQPG